MDKNSGFFSKEWLEERRFLFLLISMLFLFFVHPFFEKSDIGTFILDIGYLIILLSSIYAISERKKVFFISLFLAFVAFSSTALNYLFMTNSLRLVTTSSLGLFFIVMAVAILSTIMKSEKVRTETIYAAICVYLLLGIIWMMLFSVIEIIEPGSFLLGGAPVVDWQGEPVRRNVFSNFVYYSFVTLTTLGYGDITPVSPQARGLSSLEAVVGQLYIAVLIARLVGMHIVDAGGKE
jgi:hypothetical protein